MGKRGGGRGRKEIEPSGLVAEVVVAAGAAGFSFFVLVDAGTDATILLLLFLFLFIAISISFSTASFQIAILGSPHLE